MRRPFSRPPSLAEKIAANQRGLNFYASIAGKPQVRLGAIPVRRKRVPVVGAPPKEHQEQVNYVKWFRRTYTGVLIFAIPNGGMRDPIIGFQMKAEGVTPDVPDLFCPKFKLFVEMKRVGGSRPAGQKLMGEYLVKCGYGHFFAMGADDAMRKTLEYLARGTYAD